LKSRQRVIAAINHQKPDRVPVDLGSTDVTGIHVTALDNLRKELKLEYRKVKAFEPMMMLGYVENDVIDAVGGDVIGLHSPVTLLGYWNKNWKPWKLPNGTEVLVGGGFSVTRDSNGTIYAYPNGNRSFNPSAKMPSNGWYFDPISRQEDISEHDYNARKDYADQYPVFSDEICKYYEETSRFLYEETNYAIIGDFSLGGLGDFFVIPAPWLEKTKGIRNLEDWMLAYHDHPDYIHELFEMQTESAIENLKLYQQAIGERLSVIVVSGTDFGSQNGPLISPDFYRTFYKPYHNKINEWIHTHTLWKVFFHSCGSVVGFLDDFIEAGVDIINPLQYSAAGMDLELLKDKYGSKLVFWGGGIDTQRVLPFGTVDEVRNETRKNVNILFEGGGYICAAVHNIQGPTPVENICAFFDAIRSTSYDT
jgi:uroporphyrinogen-III decarboxylase